MITISKSVLISIQPYYVFLIIAKAMGWNITQEKTIEVRKTIPKDKAWDKKAIIYCSKNKKSFAKIPKEYQPLMNRFLGKVIGNFVCDSIISHCEMANADIAEQQGCIKRETLLEYSNGKELFGLHISNLVIYDKPKELSEFKHDCNGICVDTKAKIKCERFLKEGFSCSKLKPFKRPFQSWGYVYETDT